MGHEINADEEKLAKNFWVVKEDQAADGGQKIIDIPRNNILLHRLPQPRHVQLPNEMYGPRNKCRRRRRQQDGAGIDLLTAIDLGKNCRFISWTNDNKRCH